MKKKSQFKSNLLLILSVVSLFIVVNGTVAWLTGKSNLLKDQFSYGNIKISIHDQNEIDNENKINYEIVPGSKIEKKTYIKVKEKSEDCWLFIKIDETDNFKEFMTYSLEDDWINLKENIYYMKVNKSDREQIFNVIENDEMLVKEDITKEQFATLTSENYPTFSIAAYAVQRNENIDEIDTALEAWQLVNG